MISYQIYSKYNIEVSKFSPHVIPPSNVNPTLMQIISPPNRMMRNASVDFSLNIFYFVLMYYVLMHFWCLLSNCSPSTMKCPISFMTSKLKVHYFDRFILVCYMLYSTRMYSNICLYVLDMYRAVMKTASKIIINVQ